MENKDLREMIKNMFIDFPEPDSPDALLEAIREGCSGYKDFVMPSRADVISACEELVNERILKNVKGDKYGPQAWFIKAVEKGLEA